MLNLFNGKKKQEMAKKISDAKQEATKIYNKIGPKTKTGIPVPLYEEEGFNKGNNEWERIYKQVKGVRVK